MHTNVHELFQSPGFVCMDDDITLVAPEDGGYPRAQSDIVRRGPNTFELRLGPFDTSVEVNRPGGRKVRRRYDGGPYFMVEAVNPSAHARPVTIDIDEPPEPPYFYLRTPDGKWTRRYLEEGESRLVVSLPPEWKTLEHHQESGRDHGAERDYLLWQRHGR